MKTVWTFVWHFLVVLLLLAVVAAGFGLSQGASFYYKQSDTAFKSDGEGPHLFLEGNEWVSQTVRGNGDDGFRVEETRYPLGGPITLDVAFPLDGSHFSVQATPQFVTPPTHYQDGEPILAISDIEGNYRTFRDFLITSKVIDRNLNWTFGKGHLVLVGDFVDRGASVTQVLWLIYKLERSAELAGGRVHYILGNHEIKHLQGNFQSANEKYFNSAAIFGRQQSDLFGENAFLGRWLASKNTIEIINGTAFVHGGLHPDLATRSWSAEDINRIVRAQYRRMWFPKADSVSEDFLVDPKTGPSWYRGYFKDDLSQAQIEGTLAKFDAKAIVVGHTLQSRAKSLYNGKVFAIDVKHPWDYRSGFPPRSSEGLWVQGGKVKRVLENGSRVAL